MSLEVAVWSQRLQVNKFFMLFFPPSPFTENQDFLDLGFVLIPIMAIYKTQTEMSFLPWPPRGRERGTGPDLKPGSAREPGSDVSSRTG